MVDPYVLERLGRPRRVLVAGCGGGYDVLGAVPIEHALRAAGVEVELASLSFCYLNGLQGAEQDRELPNLYRVTGAAQQTSVTDANNRNWVFQIDSAGRMIQGVNPLDQKTTLAWDGDNNVGTLTENNGARTSRTFDQKRMCPSAN